MIAHRIRWLIIVTLAALSTSLSSGGCAAASNDPTAPKCCKVCTTGKPCGDTCIAKNLTCHTAGGCACASAG